MAITLNGIAAKERWEAYEKGRSDRGPFVKKEYLVDFADADDFVDAIMGGAVADDPVNGLTSYTGRQPCPENPTLYAVEASYKGLAETDHTGAGRPQFQYAVVPVTYGVLSWEQAASEGATHSLPNEAAPGQPHVYAVQEIDFSDEYITVPDQTMKFSSDSKKVNAPIGVHVARATIRFTRKFVPYFPVDTLLSKMNGINDAVFLGRPRGTVRFANAKTHREAVSDGTKVQEIELVFEYREFDWNKFLRPDGYSFDTVVDDSGISPYTYRDLKPLLK